MKLIMPGIKKFAEDLKQYFNKINPDKIAKRFYENTYTELISTEKKISGTFGNLDWVTIELKKYLYDEPGKNSLYFYRVVIRFHKNIYYNSFLKLVFDDADNATRFFSNLAAYAEKSIKVKFRENT